MLSFCKYLLIFWVALLAVDITGKLFLRILKLQITARFSRLFWEMCAGIICIIFFYSVILTKGNTVFAGLIIPFLFGVFFLRRERSEEKVSEHSSLTKGILKDFSYILLAGTPLFLWEFFRMIESDGSNFKIVYPDFYFYAYISDTLNAFKEENRWGFQNHINPDLFKGSMPYHYGELWLNALVSRVSNAPSVLCLKLCTYPLLSATALIGFWALWESKGKLDWSKVLLTFSFLFINGIYFTFFDRFEDLGSTLFTNVSALTYFGKKLSIVYVVLIATALAYCSRQRTLFLFVFGFLLFFYFSLSPGVVAASIIVLAILYFSKSIDKKEFAVFIAYLSAVLLFFWFFYGFVSKNDFISQPLREMENKWSSIISNPFDIGSYAYVLMVNLRWYFDVFLFFGLYAVFMLFYFLNRSSANHLLFLVLFVLLVFFSGVIAALLAPWPDHWQFFSNSLQAVSVAIAFSIILADTYFTRKGWPLSRMIILRVCIGGLLLAAVLGNKLEVLEKPLELHSEKYQTQCIEELRHSKQDEVIGFLSSGFDKLDSYRLYYSIHANRPAYFVSNFPGLFHFCALNIQDYPAYYSPKPFDRYNLLNHPLYVFEHYDSTGREFDSKEQAVSAFIEKYDVKHVFAYKGVFPGDSLFSQIKDSIVDEKSGERLYILRNEFETQNQK